MLKAPKKKVVMSLSRNHDQDTEDNPQTFL